MGNKGSRDASLTRRMDLYIYGNFHSNYAITNYHDQIIQFHRFGEQEGRASLKFIKTNGEVFLRIKYNSEFYGIVRSKTYKEGDTLYIEMDRIRIIRERRGNSLDLCDKNDIPWPPDLKKIRFSFDDDY